ncbi:uncharacterized protein A4U43_C08F23940 [Asparagus officinalis]|nr:uncharacterized protein A4U43_C08F23940 [Asparagus officinalis]
MLPLSLLVLRSILRSLLSRPIEEGMEPESPLPDRPSSTKEANKVAESRRNRAGEVVGVEEENGEAGEAGEGRRDGASELLEVAEIKNAEVGKVADRRRDCARHGSVESRPGRVRLTTRPVEGSQATPSHLQQSVEALHVLRRPDGSEVMLDLTARRAERSTGLQAEDV